jgi:hypothetical protein
VIYQQPRTHYRPRPARRGHYHGRTICYSTH